MIKEFVKFLQRGNVIDLATAVIIGGAFNAIVTSLVNDIIMPLVGIILGRVDFKSLKYTVGSAEITYGNFLQAIVNFLIIAFVLFLVIRAYNNMRRKEEVKPPAKEELPRDTVLLTEIRDLLRSNPGTGTTIDRPATK
jgi:large conductance mechanosensitive channel